MNIDAIIAESNLIDGSRDSRGAVRKYNACTAADREAWDELLALEHLTVDDAMRFVTATEPGTRIRDLKGVASKVASYVGPPGGTDIPEKLDAILMSARTGDPYNVHFQLCALRPFTTCNGHFARAVWAWMILRTPARDQSLSFLLWMHEQTLDRNRMV